MRKTIDKDPRCAVCRCLLTRWNRPSVPTSQLCWGCDQLFGSGQLHRDSQTHAG
jgi:hypothetical protein